MLFHFKATLLPGGFSGVDVFFVISGYVVSRSLYKGPRDDFFSYIFHFYARRVTRIYPALIACLLAVGLFQVLLVPASWLSTATDQTAAYAFFGLSNLALVWFSDGYFSPLAEFNAFTHTWSLAVEEQFYVLFPFIFFAWLKGQDGKPTTRTIANYLLGVLLLASLVVSWRQTSGASDHAYYMLPSRFWELAAGALLFKLQTQGRFVTETGRGRNSCLASGLGLIGAGFSFADPKAFPFPWAVLPVLGALFVIIAATSTSRERRWHDALLGNPLIVFVGKMSYSLYLWHWPVIVIFRWTVGLENPYALFSAALITLLASLFSYFLIERPSRRSKFLLARTNWQVVSLGAVAIVAGYIASAKTFEMRPRLSLSVTKDMMNWYPEPWPTSSQPELPSAPTDIHGRKIFLLGDSHAGAYKTMLQMLSDKEGVVVKQYSKGGCAIANLLSASSPQCAAFAGQATNKIANEASRGDIVFLASLRMNRLGDQWATFDEHEVARKQDDPVSVAQRSAALQEADSLISSLEKAGLTVVIDAPKPVLKSPPFRCSDWFNSDNPVCRGGRDISRDFLLQLRKPVMDSMAQLASRHPGLIVWDNFSTLCPDTRCKAFDNGLPVFFDGDHLSGHGNAMLYPSFVALVSNIWGGL